MIISERRILHYMAYRLTLQCERTISNAVSFLIIILNHQTAIPRKPNFFSGVATLKQWRETVCPSLSRGSRTWIIVSANSSANILEHKEPWPIQKDLSAWFIANFRQPVNIALKQAVIKKSKINRDGSSHTNKHHSRLWKNRKTCASLKHRSRTLFVGNILKVKFVGWNVIYKSAELVH